MKQNFLRNLVIIIALAFQSSGWGESFKEENLLSEELLSSSNFFKKAEEFVLKNGMRFVVLPNHRFPVVTQHLMYQVGSADEPEGKSGIAHLLEHLMFSLGTHDREPKEFLKNFLSGGAQADNNAYTSEDVTVYESTFPSEKIETIFKLEADRMRNLKFDAVIIDKEKDVVWEEHLLRLGNNSEGKLWQNMLPCLYWVHPYKRWIGGWPHELTTASLEDLQQFYNKWYVPSNAICVIVGNITMEKVKELAEKYYGNLPAQKAPLQQRPQEPEHFNNPTIRIDFEHEKDAGSFTTRLVYALPSFEGDIKKLFINKILNAYLQNGVNSYLYKKVVINQKLARDIWLSNYLNKDNGFIFIKTIPVGSEEQKTLEKVIISELKNFLTEGITEQDLEVAKQKIVLQNILDQESLSDMAAIQVDFFARGYTLDQLKTIDKLIKDITVAEVMEMAKEIFTPSPRLVVFEDIYNPSRKDDE